MRKPVIGVSDQVRHKQGCTAKEDGQRFGSLSLGSRRILIHVVKTKVLISAAG